MNQRLRAYLYLHFCVLLWGFTAILGKLISLEALPLVWWRVVLCCIVLALVVPMAKIRTIPKRLNLSFLGIGALIGLHWLCFYGAIKLSNASVAVTTMAATSFFAAIAEPVILKSKFRWYEMIIGLLILPGMVLVVGNIDWSMRLGFGLGIIGALFAAVFSTFNKKLIDRHAPPSLSMSYIELFGAVLITSLGLLGTKAFGYDLAFMPQENDWIWLSVLAFVCTLLPFYLTLQAMQHITAFATNLTINLEPVYGVLLAAVIFQENQQLNTNFYVGVVIILLAVFSHPFLKKRFH